MNSLTKTTLVLIASLFALSACETTEGFGRDLQKGGKNLSSAAERNDGNSTDDTTSSRYPR